MVESMLGDAELPTAEREVSCSDEDELTPPDAQAQIGVGFDRPISTFVPIPSMSIYWRLRVR